MFFLQELYAIENAAEKIANSNLASLMPLLLVCVVFYFLVIRPSQTKNKKHKEMLEGLCVGNRVCTTGGIFGSVSNVKKDSDSVFVKIADGVDIEILKDSIVTVTDEESEAKQKSPTSNSKKKSPKVEKNKKAK